MEVGLTAGSSWTVLHIWYVIVINVLRSVARTRRLISNVLNSSSEDNSFTSMQTDLRS